MCNKDDEISSNEAKISELKAVYKLAVETRNFEISQLINRNNFFMLFQGVLLAAVFSNQAPKPIVEFIICFSGIIISGHQIKVAAGAKYWQEWWELKTSEIENKLKDTIGKDNFIPLFSLSAETDEEKEEMKNFKEKVIKKINKPESKFLEIDYNKIITTKYSVSRVPIYTGFVLMLTWVALLFSTLGWFHSFDFSDFIHGIQFEKAP
ncbi:RipA family octameric membrane protein [Acinetobacter bohemicus]|uniref:RipA family octameric membrane protein n=1 Tax=Acinetobacter bohemicus TaxID=1435036 RepID=UPI00192C58BA|nr:hypothetical protein [Acinetobacter bohemicus]CAD9197407.1 hypothetical protein QAC21B_03578 [Acinetobacter bohemicus]